MLSMLTLWPVFRTVEYAKMYLGNKGEVPNPDSRKIYLSILESRKEKCIVKVSQYIARSLDFRKENPRPLDPSIKYPRFSDFRNKKRRIPNTGMVLFLRFPNGKWLIPLSLPAIGSTCPSKGKCRINCNHSLVRKII